MKKVLKKDLKTIIMGSTLIIGLVLLILADVFKLQVLDIMAYSVLCIGNIISVYLTRDEELRPIIAIAFAVIWGLCLIETF